MSHYYTNSASLPTKRRSNTTLPQYESTEQKLDLSPQSAPNPVVFMGPITRESHERLLQQQQRQSKAKEDTTTANIELDDHGDIKQPLLKPFQRLASDNSSSDLNQCTELSFLLTSSS